MSKVYGWLLSVGAVLLLLLGVRRKGREAGENEKELKNLREVNKAYEKAKESSDRIDSIPDDELDDRLQYFTRKSSTRK